MLLSVRRRVGFFRAYRRVSRLWEEFVEQQGRADGGAGPLGEFCAEFIAALELLEETHEAAKTEEPVSVSCRSHFTHPTPLSLDRVFGDLSSVLTKLLSFLTMQQLPDTGSARHNHHPVLSQEQVKACLDVIVSILRDAKYRTLVENVPQLAEQMVLLLDVATGPKERGLVLSALALIGSSPRCHAAIARVGGFRKILGLLTAKNDQVGARVVHTIHTFLDHGSTFNGHISFGDPAVSTYQGYDDGMVKGVSADLDDRHVDYSIASHAQEPGIAYSPSDLLIKEWSGDFPMRQEAAMKASQFFSTMLWAGKRDDLEKPTLTWHHSETDMEAHVLKENMRLQGVLDTLTANIEGSTYEMQIGLVETLVKLLIRSKENQAEFDRIGGFSILEKLLLQFNPPINRSPLSLQETRVVETLFSLVAVIIIDGNPSYCCGNLECLKWLLGFISTLSTSSNMPIINHSVTVLHDLVSLNPANALHIHYHGGIDVLLQLLTHSIASSETTVNHCLLYLGFALTHVTNTVGDRFRDMLASPAAKQLSSETLSTMSVFFRHCLAEGVFLAEMGTVPPLCWELLQHNLENEQTKQLLELIGVCFDSFLTSSAFSSHDLAQGMQTLRKQCEKCNCFLQAQTLDRIVQCIGAICCLPNVCSQETRHDVITELCLLLQPTSQHLALHTLFALSRLLERTWMQKCVAVTSDSCWEPMLKALVQLLTCDHQDVQGYALYILHLLCLADVERKLHLKNCIGYGALVSALTRLKVSLWRDPTVFDMVLELATATSHPKLNMRSTLFRGLRCAELDLGLDEASMDAPSAVIEPVHNNFIKVGLGLLGQSTHGLKRVASEPVIPTMTHSASLSLATKEIEPSEELQIPPLLLHTVLESTQHRVFFCDEAALVLVQVLLSLPEELQRRYWKQVDATILAHDINLQRLCRLHVFPVLLQRLPSVSKATQTIYFAIITKMLSLDVEQHHIQLISRLLTLVPEQRLHPESSLAANQQLLLQSVAEALAVATPDVYAQFGPPGEAESIQFSLKGGIKSCSFLCWFRLRHGHQQLLVDWQDAKLELAFRCQEGNRYQVVVSLCGEATQLDGIVPVGKWSFLVLQCNSQHTKLGLNGTSLLPLLDPVDLHGVHGSVSVGSAFHGDIAQFVCIESAVSPETIEWLFKCGPCSSIESELGTVEKPRFKMDLENQPMRVSDASSRSAKQSSSFTLDGDTLSFTRRDSAPRISFIEETESVLLDDMHPGCPVIRRKGLSDQLQILGGPLFFLRIAGRIGLLPFLHLIASALSNPRSTTAMEAADGFQMLFAYMVEHTDTLDQPLVDALVSIACDTTGRLRCVNALALLVFTALHYRDTSLPLARSLGEVATQEVVLLWAMSSLGPASLLRLIEFYPDSAFALIPVLKRMLIASASTYSLLLAFVLRTECPSALRLALLHCLDQVAQRELQQTFQQEDLGAFLSLLDSTDEQVRVYSLVMLGRLLEQQPKLEAVFVHRQLGFEFVLHRLASHATHSQRTVDALVRLALDPDAEWDDAAHSSMGTSIGSSQHETAVPHIFHPVRLHAALGLLGIITDADVHLRTLDRLSQLFDDAGNVQACLSTHWLEWCREYVARLDEPAFQIEGDRTGKRKELILTRMILLLQKILLWDMHEHPSRCHLHDLRELVDAPSFQAVVLEAVLLYFETNPTFEAPAASRLLRNLVTLYEQVDAVLGLVPHICIRIIRSINLIASQNTNTVRSRMKDLGIFDIRNHLMLHFLDHPSREEELADTLRHINFEMVSSYPKFRSQHGILYIVRLLHRSSTATQNQIVHMIRHQIGLHTDNLRELSKLFDDSGVLSHLFPHLGSETWASISSNRLSCLPYLPYRDVAVDSYTKDDAAARFLEWYFSPEREETRQRVCDRIDKALAPAQAQQQKQEDKAKAKQQKQLALRTAKVQRQQEAVQKSIAEWSAAVEMECGKRIAVYYLAQQQLDQYRDTFTSSGRQACSKLEEPLRVPLSCKVDHGVQCPDCNWIGLSDWEFQCHAAMEQCDSK